jgi:uncharacterized protein involved in response to NO
VLNFQASFLAAPHRVMFFGGTVQALLAMAFWSLHAGGHYAGLWEVPVWPLLTVFPAAMVHALLMAGGVFPWFVFGFILTAGPRWQGAADLGQGDFLPPFLLLASGWTVAWIALLFPAALPVGMLSVLAGWLLVARILTRIALQAAASREHIACVAIAAWAGTAGMAAFAMMGASKDFVWGRLGLALTVWGFLLPVFVSVAHRMLPFFTSAAVRGYAVRRPAWALRVLVVASLTHGLLAFAELPDWSWIADLPAMLAAATLSRVWWHHDVLGNRMVSVLHIAFAWLTPTFALYMLQSLAPGSVGQAPMHALALGFFSSMLIGMVTRVTLGHSGRPVLADPVMWAAFCAMQAATVLRLAAELPLPGVAANLLWFSSVAWLGAFAVWAAAYGPLLWRPRTDGKSG